MSIRNTTLTHDLMTSHGLHGENDCNLGHSGLFLREVPEDPNAFRRSITMSHEFVDRDLAMGFCNAGCTDKMYGGAVFSEELFARGASLGSKEGKDGSGAFA
jgi:hypothetical protein